MSNPQFNRFTRRPGDAVDLPDYTPELARELRAAAGLSGDSMAVACGLLGGRQAWHKIESGRAPMRAVWLLALIVAGRHPEYGRRTG